MILDFSNQTDDNISEDIFEDLLKMLPKVIPAIEEQHVELLLTDNSTIKEINAKYRNKNAITDVLAFAERETPEGMFNASNLGQIVISVERAAEQAKDLGQSTEEELRFLFTHGLLHLLGYKHKNPQDEEIMLEKAYKILGRN